MLSHVRKDLNPSPFHCFSNYKCKASIQLQLRLDFLKFCKSHFASHNGLLVNYSIKSKIRVTLQNNVPFSI